MELRRRVDSSQTYSQLLSPEDPPIYARPVRPRAFFTSPLDASERWYWLGLIAVTVAAIATRFYCITEPQHVA